MVLKSKKGKTMRRLIFIFVIVLALCIPARAITYNAFDRQTFFNGYAWGSHPQKDRAWIWAKDMQALAEVGMQLGTGSIFYVDSGQSTSGDGRTWNTATTTLDAAVNLCSDSRGDFILVAQGHNEALDGVDGVDVDIIGVTIIGIGRGSLMPTLDYDQAADEFVIGADNVSIFHIRFRSSTPSTTLAIDIEDGDDYAHIAGCLFDNESDGTDFFLDAIKITNASIGTLIEGNIFAAGEGSANHGIHLDADTDGTIIRNNTIRGDYAVANIKGDTTLSTNLIIDKNFLWNGVTSGLNGQPVIELLTGTVGLITENYFACNVGTVAAAKVGDGMFSFGNWYNEDAGDAATAVHLGSLSDTGSSSVNPSGDD